MNRKSLFYFFALLFLTEISLAKTYYVSTSGKNTNTGTQSAPWRNVAYAVSKMVAGDTTFVRSGIYIETLIQFTRSGTQSAPIKLLNFPGEVPVIDFGVNFTNKLIHRITLDAPGDNVPIGWITIEGFEIRRGYEGIKYNSVHNITIRRNRMHSHISSAILGSSGKNILIDRNAIYNNGPQDFNTAHVHGMYLTGLNYVITNNLIYGSGCYGIQVAGYPWDMKEYYEDPKDYKRGPDASYAGAANWVIANNTFAYNGCSGIVLWRSSADNNKIFNNIFYENSVKSKVGSEGVNGVNFVATGGQVGNKIQNNIFYASGSGGMRMFGVNGKVGVNYTQSANTTANPNFVNAPTTRPSSPSFALKANSLAAVNKGLNLWSTVVSTRTSYNGVLRNQSKPYDIGAYEYGTASAILLAPTNLRVND